MSLAEINKLKISIITATFNSKAHIESCIESVTSQSYKDIEYIIIDGGSIDGTVQTVKDCELTIKNKVNRFNFVSEPDGGIYDAMNKGIRIATGDIVGTLNSDDQFYTKKAIELVANEFQNNNIDCCFGNLVFVDNSNKIIRKWHSRPFESDLFAKSWTPAHPTFYCKRELFEKYGLYKTDYKIASDVELMLRFLEVMEVRSAFLNEYLVKMRTGGVSNQGIKSTIIITKEIKRAFRENGLTFNLSKYLFYKLLKLKEFIV